MDAAKIPWDVQPVDQRIKGRPGGTISAIYHNLERGQPAGFEKGSNPVYIGCARISNHNPSTGMVAKISLT